MLEPSGPGGDALGAHGGGGHQFDHVLARALRTFGREIRRRQNQSFKTVTTAFTLIFIDRHRFFLLQKKAFIDGFGPLVKTKPHPMPSGVPGHAPGPLLPDEIFILFTIEMKRMKKFVLDLLNFAWRTLNFSGLAPVRTHSAARILSKRHPGQPEDF